MKLKVKPSDKNLFPLKGMIIKGDDPKHWINEIQRLELNMELIKCFAIPDKTINSVWACLICVEETITPIEDNPHPLCQLMHGKIFLPGLSILFPGIGTDELNLLFPGNIYYFAHPQVGIVPLETEINWSEFIDIKEARRSILKPTKGTFIPKELKSIQLQPKDPEDVLKSFEAEQAKDRSTAPDKPLNLIEKIKLSLLRGLLRKKKPNESDQQNGPAQGSSWFSKLFGKSTDALEKQLDDLEERNKKSMDKLMELFKKDPSEALKYAIPLTEGEAFRGTEGLMQFMKRWSDFSIFGNLTSDSATQSGAAILPSGHYDLLRSQYIKTAQDLEKAGNYEKAAFVYLKLLKQPFSAAQSLEKGGYYEEAASLYLNQIKDKSAAARCYEKGLMIENAIHLYKELEENEKVGDLYSQINRKEEAIEAYNLVVEKHIKNNHFIKAGDVIKLKIKDELKYLELMKEGWIKNIEQIKCLDNYLKNIEEPDFLNAEIEDIYKNHTSNQNIEDFLKVLLIEFKRERESLKNVKELSYKIISENSDKKKHLLNHLNTFNLNDRLLNRDIGRYKNK